MWVSVLSSTKLEGQHHFCHWYFTLVFIWKVLQWYLGFQVLTSFPWIPSLVCTMSHITQGDTMYLLSINSEAFYTRCESYDTGCSLVFASIKGREILDLNLERLQKKSWMEICKSVRFYEDTANSFVEDISDQQILTNSFTVLWKKLSDC